MPIFFKLIQFKVTLPLASLRGHIKVVKELIRKGANIEAQTFGEDNALIHGWFVFIKF